mgnify:FL=1|tara:strand:- start:131 stop:349 length:219 start_codon:yes stop_codon:yes gene_type:complete
MALVIQADHVSPTSAAIFWRDAELARTDIAATVSDYPNAAAIITYRAALRDWPDQNDDGEYINGFPDTRPEL